MVIFACCLPPLIAAWQALKGNRRRIWWFTGFLVLPFALLPIKGALLENYLLMQKHFMAESIIGVPEIVILVDAVCLAAALILYEHLAGKPAPQLRRS